MADEIEKIDGQLATMADNKVKLLAAIMETNGVAKDAYELLNIGCSTYYRYMREDEDFREAVDDINRQRVEKDLNRLRKLRDKMLVQIEANIDKGTLKPIELNVAYGIVADKLYKDESKVKPIESPKIEEEPATPEEDKKDEEKKAEDKIKALIDKYVMKIEPAKPTKSDG